MPAKKLAIPANPLIYKTALQYAAVFYEAGRASGLTSQYKTPEAFAKRYIERFIPLVVKNFIEMLKPTSGISEHMKEEIHAAITDPINDPQLMNGDKKNGIVDVNAETLAKIIDAYDHNQIKFKDLQMPKPKQNYKNKLLNTANPLTPKPN